MHQRISKDPNLRWGDSTKRQEQASKTGNTETERDGETERPGETESIVLYKTERRRASSRDRETETERQRQRDRETERQRDRETERQRAFIYHESIYENSAYYLHHISRHRYYIAIIRDINAY
jgi:hypothetical protein